MLRNRPTLLLSANGPSSQSDVVKPKYSNNSHIKAPSKKTKKITKTMSKRILLPLLTAISTALYSAAASADTPIDFTSQDWQVVCDNTRTCRLAGYQADNDIELPVSLLLIRRAGANATVDARVKLGGARENSAKALMQLGNRHRISLFINDRDYGEAKPFSGAAGYAELTSLQVTALLEALTKSSKIELVIRNTRWRLSDKGASAVMLKADEAQGRVGTASAFVRTEGASKSNSSVLSPTSIPEIRMVMPNPKATSGNKKKFVMRSSQLSDLMKGTIKDISSDCPSLYDKSSWNVNRLNSKQVLVQHNCWTGAYNAGKGVWVINDTKPYEPKLITNNATDYDKGQITSVQKGRGLGDCISKTEWLWTGKDFEKSHESSTGLCRMIGAGGAWQMPLYVTDVKLSR